jgi:hypothetical protein
MLAQVEMTYSKSKISLDGSQQQDAANACVVTSADVVPASTESLSCIKSQRLVFTSKNLKIANLQLTDKIVDEAFICELGQNGCDRCDQ